jgi:hypothetical protein
VRPPPVATVRHQPWESRVSAAAKGGLVFSGIVTAAEGCYRLSLGGAKFEVSQVINNFASIASSAKM